jgi:hypothetical protein
MPGSATIIERNSDLVFRRIADEGVLVPLYQQENEENCIYTLNGIGAFIWEKLERPSSVEELRSAIFAEYEVEPDTLDADLDRFLVEMKTIGAIKEVP